jgi:hypothetical protein
VREDATLGLVGAGRQVVAPLTESLASRDLEAVVRGLYVLRELALSSDLATEESAQAALEKLAAAPSAVAARRASSTLASLSASRRDRAMERLKELGAKFNSQHLQFGFQVVEVTASLEIDESFQGDVGDLRHLRWLSDMRHVTLRGEKVTDAWLAKLTAMEDSLLQLSLKRCKISDEGLAPLASLKRLQVLDILYSPVTDQGIGSLKAVQSLAKVRLYGTKITREGADQLAPQIAEVDWRKGAFLGVSCSPTGPCILQQVIPGSGAEKAGIEPGDIIVKYNDKPVTDFPTLTAHIAKHEAGDTIKLEIVRNGELITREVTFGEWE